MMNAAGASTRAASEIETLVRRTPRICGRAESTPFTMADARVHVLPAAGVFAGAALGISAVEQPTLLAKDPTGVVGWPASLVKAARH